MTHDLQTILAAAHRATEGIADRSGSVFYSGKSTFAAPREVYILGLNPGGSPERQAEETIGRDLREWVDRPPRWSRFLDESWRGKPPGKHGMQPRLQHMFANLGLDLRHVPASNVVFVRTNSEAALRSEANELLNRCWEFHETVIQRLGVKTLVCLGASAGQWACLKLSATKLLGTYRESNQRGWASKAHLAPDGRAVVTVTHPGRADWRNPNADPTPFVRSIIQRV